MSVDGFSAVRMRVLRDLLRAVGLTRLQTLAAIRFSKTTLPDYFIYPL